MTKKAKRRTTKAKQSRSNTSKTTTYALVGIGIIAVIVLGALLILNLNARSQPAISGIVSFPRPSQEHDNTFEFEQTELPPAGGVHYETWLNCGIYDDPVPTGNAIHSMEHGAVWITYQPTLPEEDVAYLRNMVHDEPYVLMSPYPELKSPVVLTAWGLQLEVDSVEDDRVAQFVDIYQAGPQTPERGASCRNGTGTPMVNPTS